MSDLPGTPRVQIYPASDETTGYASAPTTSSGLLNVANYWWDTNTLQWTKATGGSLPGANVNVQNFPASFGASQVGPWSVAVNNIPAVQPVSESDGANVAIGTTTDGAVTTNAAGTLSSKMRGIVTILASVWDSVNAWLQIRIASNGDVIDTANSSTTPLLANGEFAGPWTNVLNYAQVVITIYSDQSGAGMTALTVQFSSDGVNVDHEHTYESLAVVGESVQVHTHEKYYRLIYANGPINQTVFRLQAILRPVAGSGTIIEADDIITKYDDCVLGKAIITGAANDGSGYVNVLTTPEGALTINQNTPTDPLNGTTANLIVGGTFTGTWVKTHAYTAVQYIFNCDQNCQISIDQSSDGANVDVTDSEIIYASEGGEAEPIQIYAPWYRIRLTNIGFATSTHLRLLSTLVPFLAILPRALDEDGSLPTGITSTKDDNGFARYFTPFGEAISVPIYHLTGAVFNGSTLDTTAWTAVVGAGGTVAPVAGLMGLTTGTTANNATSLVSNFSGRFVSGSPHQYRTTLRLGDTGTANNTRTWGCYTSLTGDGIFFELVGTVFSVCMVKAGVIARISNGSFNGVLGNRISLDTNMHFYQIFYTPSYVWFLYDNELLHKQGFPLSSWSSTLDLPVRMDNINSGGSTSNVSMYSTVATLLREGLARSEPISIFQAGTTAALLCKIGSGNVRQAVISGIVNNAVITIYDSLTATGRVVWSSGTLGSQTNPFPLDFGGAPFNIGLTLAITGAAANVFLSFE